MSPLGSLSTEGNIGLGETLAWCCTCQKEQCRPHVAILLTLLMLSVLVFVVQGVSQPHSLF